MLRALMTAFAFCLAAAQLQAATPFGDELPIELARFFQNGGRWYAGAPPGFPELPLPAGMRIVGGLDQAAARQVLLRHDTSVQAATDLLVALLERQGWLDITDPRASQGGVGQPAGFVVPVQLCDDRHGVLSVTAVSAEALRLQVSALPRLVRPVAQPGPLPVAALTCAQLREMQQAAGGGGPSGLHAELPTLVVGTEALIAGGGRGAFVSVGGRESFAEAGGRVRSPADHETLAMQLGSQMLAQGWQRVDSAAGQVTAGSTWTRSSSRFGRLEAVLSIMKVGDGMYDCSVILAPSP